MPSSLSQRSYAGPYAAEQSRALLWQGQSPAEVVTRAVREFEQTREWRRDVLHALEDAVRSLTASELSRALARATTSG